MFVVAAQYYAKEGNDDEIAAILKKMIPVSRAEPGCALYIVNRSVEDPRIQRYRGPVPIRDSCEY